MLFLSRFKFLPVLILLVQCNIRIRHLIIIIIIITTTTITTIITTLLLNCSISSATADAFVNEYNITFAIPDFLSSLALIFPLFFLSCSNLYCTPFFCQLS